MHSSDIMQQVKIFYAHARIHKQMLFSNPNPSKLLEKITHHDVVCARKGKVLKSILDKRNEQSIQKLINKLHTGTLTEQTPFNVSVKDRQLFTYVIWGMPERVEFYLARNANPNIRDEHGHTPLSIALERYATLNSQDIFSKSSFEKIISSLVSYGAYDEIPSKTYTSFEEAIDAYHKKSEIKAFNKLASKISTILKTENSWLRNSSSYYLAGIIQQTNIKFFDLSPEEQARLVHEKFDNLKNHTE